MNRRIARSIAAVSCGDGGNSELAVLTAAWLVRAEQRRAGASNRIRGSMNTSKELDSECTLAVGKIL
jgi:hypothetical protein